MVLAEGLLNQWEKGDPREGRMVEDRSDILPVSKCEGRELNSSPISSCKVIAASSGTPALSGICSIPC